MKRNWPYGRDAGGTYCFRAELLAQKRWHHSSSDARRGASSTSALKPGCTFLNRLPRYVFSSCPTVRSNAQSWFKVPPGAEMVPVTSTRTLKSVLVSVLRSLPSPCVSVCSPWMAM